MDKVIELDNVTKDFGGGKGVFEINFSVKRGEVFGYLGPNGAGKSTTIRQLMGFIKPDEGKCTVFGEDCFYKAAQIQKYMGYLAGEIAFMEDMTGIGYLKFMADMKGLTNLNRMKELTKMFELDANGKIKKMSKGMKQKLGIVCAFMNEPQVAILDEPTSGLDPLMQNRFVELILEERGKGTTILMSSHMFEEVEKTCDRTAIIREGKVVDVVNMEDLSKIKKKMYTVTMENTLLAEKLAREESLNVEKIIDNKVSFLVNDNVAQVLRTIAKYDPVELDVATQSIEELFLQYYGGKDND